MNELTRIELGEAAAVAAGPLCYPPGFHMIPADWLWVDPEHLRKMPATGDADGALVASIKVHGVLQPLVVRWLPGEGGNLDSYLVLAGRRRLVAAMAAGLTELPCMVRETADEAEELGIELTENIVRADMSQLDVFEGVHRMLKAGASEAAVAVMFNLTERRVAQLRAMGGMHPAIVAHIRATGDMPPQAELKVICQAGLTLQGEAYHAAVKQAGRGNEIRWWQVSAGCRVETIPLSRARFDVALYKGPIHSDLFATEATREASSPSLFLKLQREWLVDEFVRRKTAGYSVGEGETDGFGGMKKPRECGAAYKSVADREPAKKKRAEWRYVAVVQPDGTVCERLYPVEAAKASTVPVKGVSDGVAGESSEAAAPQAGGVLKTDLVTKLGLERVEQAKREAVAESVAMSLYAPDLLAVALLLLAEKCRTHRRDAAEALLLDGSGAIDVVDDNRDLTIRGLATRLLPALLREQGATEILPLALVDRIGVGFGAQPVMKLDRDGLDLLKKSGLELVRKARGMPGFNTQKELKSHIMRTAATGTPPLFAVTAAELGMLACDPASELPTAWPRGTIQTASTVPTQLVTDVPDDDDDDDQPSPDGFEED